MLFEGAGILILLIISMVLDYLFSTLIFFKLDAKLVLENQIVQHIQFFHYLFLSFEFLSVFWADRIT